jgi:serine/threonine-protein kinase
MVPEQRDWQRLDAALQRAFENDPATRTARLQELLGDRPDLLAAALQALEAPTEEPSVQALAPGLIAAIGDDLDRHEDSHWRDQRLGPWRILERIGQGGMGAVYRGERADGAFEREVAIKLLPLSLQDDDMIRRFEQERRIAGRLEHPGIARLLDGGTAEDGSPWLVMEYVDGEAIDRWAEQRQLDVRARVELLIQVCAAVEFAHRNLVVHRDLKPANILVDRHGRIRLLDFGIARLLEDIDRDGATSALGARLTPDYAAPEQLGGGPITVATDVYALGCLAYRLLAGRVPLALAGRPLAQMLETMTDADRPSLSLLARDAAPAGVRAAALDADLDAIAGQAVRADPAERYASVSALAADLQRWHDGLPIEARPIGRVQRAAKFVRRHRAGVATAASVFAALSLTAGIALHQAGQAREQRDEARAVAGMLTELMQLADPDLGMGHGIDATGLLRQALERAVANSEATPATRIALLEPIADALIAFELAEDAERARREIHRLQAALHGDEHPQTLAALRKLALAVRDRRNRFDEAEALFVELLDRRRRVLGATHLDTAESLWDLGFLYLRFSDSAHPGRGRVVELLEQAHALHVDRLGPDHPITGRVLFDLGLATDDPQRKIERMQQGIAIRQREAAQDDLQLLQHQGDLALVLSVAGRADEAIVLAQQATEAYQAARGELHPIALILQNNLAGILRDHGHYEEALTNYRRVDELTRAVVPEGHMRRAFPVFGIGVSLAALGRPAEAEAPLREAIAILERNHRDHLVAVTRVELGDSLRAQGREDEAQAEYRGALALWTERLSRPTDDPQLLRVQDRLAAAR